MGDREQDGSIINRRRFIRDGVAGLIGWTAAATLDPFRRGMYAVISHTPLGRQPQIQIIYTGIPDSEPPRYQIQILNAGGETARNVSINLGFEEQISESTVLETTNVPPSPDVEIDSQSIGTVQVNIDHLRRQFEGQQFPVILDLIVDENTSSGIAPELNGQSGLWVAISFSWRYLGEQYFETDEYTIPAESG